MTKFGITHTDSTSTQITLLAINEDNLQSIVGKQVEVDVEIAGTKYKAIGLLTDIRTTNAHLANPSFNTMVARGAGMKSSGVDLRVGNFKIQSVFRFNDEYNTWEQHGTSLPNSPSTGVPISLMDEEHARLLVADDLPSIGYLRGMETSPARLNIQDFSSSTGATHAAVLGRSGSGKSQLYALTLASYMKHEHHAIIIVDPQGQWSNENGMIFSPQKFAKALGRDVHVMRISEDIRLPLDEEIIANILDKLDVWRKGFRRMASENRSLFSDVVVNKLIRKTIANSGYLDGDPRVILTKILEEIASSPSTLGRIYANGGDTQELFKRDLCLLAGIPYYNKDDEEEIFEAEDVASAEESWENLLQFFTPLLNLFSSKNLNGGVRKPLGGQKGFLTDIFQVRNAGSAPAPYVIFDMSPNIQLHARQALMGGNDSYGAMQKMLDNQEIKALILQAVFSEVKKSSELAFETGGGNLNTQIVFDEAWRYAPESSRSPEINKLADMLEGFALDTRKFGIGWSYILQTPSDLRSGIWKQLSYVYSGYGLVGEDLKRLEGLMDDSKMLDFYRQFIRPSSTSNKYPFMITGSLSPLIFTNAPTFINAFTGSEYLEHNKVWIDEITKRRSLPAITEEYLSSQTISNSKPSVGKGPVAVKPKSYKVGKGNDLKSSTPQTKVAPKPETKVEPVVADVDDFPF